MTPELKKILTIISGIIFVFLVAKTIMAALSQPNAATTFNPPLLGNVTSGDNQTMYGALIAVGFILAAPSIVDKIKKAFSQGSGLSIGGIGTGRAVMAGVAGGVASRLYRRDQEGNLRGAVGSRVQTWATGFNRGTGELKNPGRIRSLTGSALKVRSTQEQEEYARRLAPTQIAEEAKKKTQEANKPKPTGLVDKNGNPLTKS